MHPRPSPIAAALYTLRDLNADVIILHGPHGCCFRTGRLLENDGVRVVTTAMSENDFIFGASEKLEETLSKVGFHVLTKTSWDCWNLCQYDHWRRLKRSSGKCKYQCQGTGH